MLPRVQTLRLWWLLLLFVATVHRALATTTPPPPSPPFSLRQLSAIAIWSATTLLSLDTRQLCLSLQWTLFKAYTTTTAAAVNCCPDDVRKGKSVQKKERDKERATKESVTQNSVFSWQVYENWKFLWRDICVQEFWSWREKVFWVKKSLVCWTVELSIPIYYYKWSDELNTACNDLETFFFLRQSQQFFTITRSRCTCTSPLLGLVWFDRSRTTVKQKKEVCACVWWAELKWCACSFKRVWSLKSTSFDGCCCCSRSVDDTGSSPLMCQCATQSHCDINENDDPRKAVDSEFF